MKKFIILFSLVFTMVCWTNESFAQAPPPSDHGSTTNQSGGGAPIGGGLFILLGLGAAYGGKKLYVLKKQSQEE